MKRLLVVDDDYSMRTILQEALNTSGYQVQIAKDGTSALKNLESDEYHLVIADLVMPDMNGVELMEAARKDNPAIGFLIITAYGTVETAVEALHKGAFDFITKPFSISQIESRVQRFFDYEGLKEENQELKRKLSYDEKFNRLVGKSKDMEHVFHQIDLVAKSDVPVFIQGESGTGKELIAKAIHENSNRAGKPFFEVNCSAIPQTLFESTLFGHEKGAFTNAIRTHKGFFEAADGGTLLLDEVSEMPVAMQAKLLRVLEERKITKVGSAKQTAINVRVIATSNRNIDKMIKEEQFRSDLFFRLNVFPIKVPPLRARPQDIPVLVNHFLRKFQSKYGSEMKEVRSDTIDVLTRYNWPGNVRQLENAIERAILYSGKGKTLTLDHFALESDQLETDSDAFDGSLMSIAEMERKLIYDTLKKTSNNRTQAANILGISARTLRNKLNQYSNTERPPLELA